MANLRWWNVVNYGGIGQTMVLYGKLWRVIWQTLGSNMANFEVEYDQLRQNMANYGKIWPSMVEYGQVWQNMAKYGRIWPTMVEYGQPWWDMANHGGIWPTMVGYGQLTLAVCYSSYRKVYAEFRTS